MALSARATRAFQEMLGDAASDDFMEWIGGMEAGRVELRELSQLQIQRFTELSELQLQRFTALIDARFADQRRQTNDDLHHLATELRKEMHDRFSDLLKWSFVFWVGAVGAVAALAGVLR